MELTLKRIALKDTYTIGKLYVNGTYFCDTIEDKVRDLNKDGDLNDVGEGKIPSLTAIPYGKYEITLKVKSPKFSLKPSYNWCGGYLPRLISVPHFEGILIHAGNTADSSAGCIIVGENKIKGQVINSMATLKRLYCSVLKEASDRNEKIWIKIE
jgi:hypothetical protein